MGSAHLLRHVGTKKFDKALECLHTGATVFFNVKGDEHVGLSGVDLSTRFVNVCISSGATVDDQRGELDLIIRKCLKW